MALITIDDTAIWGDPYATCLARTGKGARCKHDPVCGALCPLHYSIAEQDISRLTLVKEDASPDPKCPF